MGTLLALRYALDNMAYVLQFSTCQARSRTQNGRIILIVSNICVRLFELRSTSVLANSILFTQSQRNAIIISNIGISAMVLAVIYCSRLYGAANVAKFYGVPWLLVTHWCKCRIHLVIR